MTDNYKMREGFGKWLVQRRLGRLVDFDGHLIDCTAVFWEAWQAAKSVPDAEVMDSLCTYSAFAGHVCNKCGRIHDGAKSVPVVGEPVAYACPFHAGEAVVNGTPCMLVGERNVNDYAKERGFPLVVKPTHSITAAELERLRKDAERKEVLEHTMLHLSKTLAKLEKYRLCMSYNDSYFGEPEGTVKRVCSELQHCIDAAIAAEGEKK